MALKCHRCQTENSNDVDRCVSCGTMLNNTVEVQALSSIQKEAPVTDNAEFEDKLDQTEFIPADELDDDKDSAPDDSTALHPVVENGKEIAEVEEAREDSPEVVTFEQGDDETTHATTKMPNMNDDDGLLHIGTVRFRGNLVLTDKDNGTIYRIENESLNEAVIGRLNAKTGYRPLVDFTDYKGKERGVSRRHATINQRGDLIFVTDHNSLNGTYLNGQRLVPEQARVMRDSDTLRIGHITLIVSFERPSSDS